MISLFKKSIYLIPLCIEHLTELLKEAKAKEDSPK